MVDDALVPAAECRPGRFLYDSLLVVGPGEVADRAQVGEPGDGGERDLLALVQPQELGAAEPAGRLEVPPDYCLVMALVVTGPFVRCPPALDPRDHAPILAPVAQTCPAAAQRSRTDALEEPPYWMSTWSAKRGLWCARTG